MLASSDQGLIGRLLGGVKILSQLRRSQAWYLLIYVRINVANKQICPHILSLLVLTGLVDPDGLAKDLDHVQHLDGLRNRAWMLVSIGTAKLLTPRSR